MKKNKTLLILLTVASLTISTTASQERQSDQRDQARIMGQGQGQMKGMSSNKNKDQRKKMTKRIKKKVKMDTIKIKYLSKLNQIQNCVLIAETKQDLKICNRRVDNLSRDVNKMEQRGKKSQQKRKRFKQ